MTPLALSLSLLNFVGLGGVLTGCWSRAGETCLISSHPAGRSVTRVFRDSDHLTNRTCRSLAKPRCSRNFLTGGRVPRVPLVRRYTLCPIRMGDSLSQPLVDSGIAQRRVFSLFLFDMLVDSLSADTSAATVCFASDAFFFVVHLGGVCFPVVPKYRSRGAVLTPTLCWRAHVHNACARGGRLFCHCEGQSVSALCSIRMSCSVPPLF